MKKFSVSEQMSKHLITVRWSQSMDAAWRLMEDYRIRHLPVVDDEGFVIGVLSDRDVNRAMNPGRPGFEQDAEVSDYMSWPAITVDEQSPLRDVALGMADEKVSAFLVTRDSKQVVGIVTSEDLLRFLAQVLKDPTLEKSAAPFSLRHLPYSPVVYEAIREIGSAGI